MTSNNPASMRWAVVISATLSLLITGGIPRLTAAQDQPPVEVDVNRPRTPFDCELPIGKKWYGSGERCLAELCGGGNVYNEYVFDGEGRRRKNPCYGQSPTDFPDK
jgi:hypothetical protein